MPGATHLYAIALGSNRRHVRHGSPQDVVAAAIVRLDRDFDLFDASAILLNPAMGAGLRDFANAVRACKAPRPATMLRGSNTRERVGRRTGAVGDERADLDLVFGAGGRWRSRRLTSP